MRGQLQRQWAATMETAALISCKMHCSTQHPINHQINLPADHKRVLAANEHGELAICEVMLVAGCFMCDFCNILWESWFSPLALCCSFILFWVFCLLLDCHYSSYNSIVVIFFFSKWIVFITTASLNQIILTYFSCPLTLIHYLCTNMNTKTALQKALGWKSTLVLTIISKMCCFTLNT